MRRCGRTACGSRWTSRPARRRRSAAWPATTPAARARSRTATWCTTSSRSTPSLFAASAWRFGPMSDPSGPTEYIQFVAAVEEPLRAGEGGDRGALSESAAQGRRLQPRSSRPAARQRRASAGRIGRHARLFRAHPPQAARIPPQRALGVCHFPKFYTAMELTQHIVKLGPSAVELVDRTMIGLARDDRRPSARRSNASSRASPMPSCWWSFLGRRSQAQQAEASWRS